MVFCLFLANLTEVLEQAGLIYQPHFLPSYVHQSFFQYPWVFPDPLCFLFCPDSINIHIWHSPKSHWWLLWCVPRLYPQLSIPTVTILMQGCPPSSSTCGYTLRTFWLVCASGFCPTNLSGTLLPHHSDSLPGLPGCNSNSASICGPQHRGTKLPLQSYVPLLPCTTPPPLHPCLCTPVSYPKCPLLPFVWLSRGLGKTCLLQEELGPLQGNMQPWSWSLNLDLFYHT